MFTGIVQAVGRVRSISRRGGDAQLTIELGGWVPDRLVVGDSISVSGVCLTVTAVHNRGFAADVSGETLAVTTLGRLTTGSRVNLEPSLAAGEPLGGHLVTGHVDGIGKVVTRERDARSVKFNFEAPPGLGRYIARKGSICIDGVSLTVNEVNRRRFSVNIIPHTLEVTTFSDYKVGHEINLEVDIIARYLERLVASSQ